MSMRVGMGRNSASDAQALRFMAQLGIQDVVLNTPPIPVKNGRWELVDIIALKNRVEEFELKLTAIENTQIDMRNDLITGGPKFGAARKYGRDDQEHRTGWHSDVHDELALPPLLPHRPRGHRQWRDGYGVRLRGRTLA